MSFRSVRKLVKLLKEALKADKMLRGDLRWLREREEYQRMVGACDMKTLSEFVKRRKKRADQRG